MKQIFLKITGRVQGVSFRAFACDEARRLNLTGWVKNCVDGSVEVCAQGEEDGLKELILWCHHGPSLARVDDAVVMWQELQERFVGFRIRHS